MKIILIYAVAAICYVAILEGCKYDIQLLRVAGAVGLFACGRRLPVLDDATKVLVLNVLRNALGDAEDNYCRAKLQAERSKFSPPSEADYLLRAQTKVNELKYAIADLEGSR